MARTIALLLFDGVEEMDFVGPWEVFTAAVDGLAEERVLTVAERTTPIRCEKGMRVLADRTYAELAEPHIILVPGGSGARREIANPATVSWLRHAAQRCEWLTSVCTGSFLLAGAGLAEGRRITTHHDFIQRQREAGGAAEIVENVRFLRDGNLLTAAGVMSGIEMSLWLVEHLWGEEVARRTRSYIAYDHPPRERREGA